MATIQLKTNRRINAKCMSKRFFYLMAAFIVAAMTFSACVEADENEGGENGNNGKGGDNPSNPAVRLLSSLYDSRFGEDTYTYTYDSQNRMTTITKNNGTAYKVTYPSANTVVYDMVNNTYTLTLNSDGRVIKWQDNGTMTQAYEYDNGYFKKHTVTAVGIVTQTDSYIWSGNNVDVRDRDALAGKSKTTFTYATTSNKTSNIAPWSVTSYGSWYIPADCWGKRTQYLVSTEKQDNPSVTTTYRYETDKDGYVTKVYTKVDNGVEKLLFEAKYK